MKAERPRALTSTRHSITLAWSASRHMPLPEASSSSEDENATLSRVPKEEMSGQAVEEDRDRGRDTRYILQMMDRITGWMTVYSGFKTVVEVGSLSPGNPFRFRVKSVDGGKESEWSDSVFAATEDEATPSSHLFRAVRTGNHSSLKKIIGQRPAIANVPDRLGRTPMEVAISGNDVVAVALLLTLGVDPRAPSIGSRKTPLMAAASCGHLDIVRVLVEKGSSWDDEDRNGLTALHYAADNSHLDVIRFAVENGADVSRKDAFGWSPLARAVILKASREVIEFLLDHGGKINEMDRNKQTPLMQAVLSGRPEIVKLLLSRNADVEARNAHGHSACEMAQLFAGKETRKIRAWFRCDLKHAPEKESSRFCENIRNVDSLFRECKEE